MTRTTLFVMFTLMLAGALYLIPQGWKELKQATKELRKIYGKRANKSN